MAATSTNSFASPWANDPNAKALGVRNANDNRGKTGEDFAKLFFESHNYEVEFLGDKAPDADLLVSFMDPDAKKMYEFLVQVKTTGTWPGTSIITTIPQGSSVSNLTSEKYDDLQKYHLPTYLMHVDLTNKCFGIKPIFKQSPKSKTTILSDFMFLMSDDSKSLEISKGLVADVISYWETVMYDNTYKDGFNSYFEK